ncbi:cation:proton antiporter domain-containing protein [Thauera mechernichensis]
MNDYLPITDPVLVFALVALLILLAPIVMGRWRLPGTIGLLLAGAILGPNALGVLARDQSFVLFGTVGLLYIMFSAALEIDLVVLKRYRMHSLVFGLLTFAIPQGVGTLVGYYVLGFSLPAAILLASLFASHTLLAYPVTRQLGIAHNQAVTTAIGGTIITDTLALLVLAVIAASTRGDTGDYFWHTLVGSLVLYGVIVLFGLPKLARWFFRNVGRNGVSEFVFVLSTVFGCAGMAHLAGSEPIVGAFLAGLALNRLIPHNSALMNRIQFTGEAIFIPFFLLSVGMLLDVSVLVADVRSLSIMLAMLTSVLVTKWLAAAATRVLLGYSREQAGLVFGLSVAQAAATLAATIVGYDLGLFDDAVVNGAIMMMLVTCIVAPLQVDHHGRKIARQSASNDNAVIGSKQRILVSLSSRAPHKALLDLAMMLREPDQQQPIFPFDGHRGQGGRERKGRSGRTCPVTRNELPFRCRRGLAADHPHRPEPCIGHPQGAARAKWNRRHRRLERTHHGTRAVLRLAGREHVDRARIQPDRKPPQDTPEHLQPAAFRHSTRRPPRTRLSARRASGQAPCQTARRHARDPHRNQTGGRGQQTRQGHCTTVRGTHAGAGEVVESDPRHQRQKGPGRRPRPLWRARRRSRLAPGDALAARASGRHLSGDEHPARLSSHTA